MASLRIVVLAALLVVVASNPSPHFGRHGGGSFFDGISKSFIRPWWPKGKCEKPHEEYKYSQGEYCLEPFGYLAKGVTDLAGNAIDILKDVATCKYPGTFDDSINAIISVGFAASGILNVFFPGLGTILGSMIISIARIVICVLGSPGVTGGAFHDRRGGYGNSGDIPAICECDYGKKWGCKKYDAEYSSPKDVIDFYELGGCKDNINSIVDKCTDGHGLQSVNGGPRFVVEVMLEIAPLFEREDCDWTDKDILTVFIKVSVAIGFVGNSYTEDLGVDLVDSLFAYAEAAFKVKGYELQSHCDEVKKRIHGCGRHNFNGALTKCDDDSNSNSDNSESNSPDENCDDNSSSSDSSSNSSSSSNDSSGNSSSNSNTESNSNADNSGSNSPDENCDDNSSSSDSSSNSSSTSNDSSGNSSSNSNAESNSNSDNSGSNSPDENCDDNSSSSDSSSNSSAVSSSNNSSGNSSSSGSSSESSSDSSSNNSSGGSSSNSSANSSADSSSDNSNNSSSDDSNNDNDNSNDECD